MIRHKVDIKDLQVGDVLDYNLVTKNGSIVLRKGSEVTQNFLDIIFRHNYMNLYYEDPQHPGDLVKPPTKNIDRAKKIEARFVDAETGISQRVDIKEMVNRMTKKGAEKNLDSIIEQGMGPPTPRGPSLRDALKEVKASQRSEEHKSSISDAYDDLVERTRLFFEAVLAGKTTDGSNAVRIIEDLLNTYVKDRNLLLTIVTYDAADEEYLYTHAVKVAIVAVNVATAMHYSKEQVMEVGLGAFFSDIGMMLTKKGLRLEQKDLNKEEINDIKMHPIYSINLVDNLKKIPLSAGIIAYQVHEREDGSGYPKGRKSHLIHLYSKIVMIADIFVAMVSNRVYRKAMQPYKAMENLLKMVKKGLLDPTVVKAFMEYMGLFPIGSLVRLSDQSIARIVGTSPSRKELPEVSIITDSKGELLPKYLITQVDLGASDCTLKILEGLGFETLNIGKTDGF